MYQVRETFYLKNGAATLDSEGGKNPVLLVAGAVVRDGVAKQYGLKAKLDAASKESTKAAEAANEPKAVAKAAAAEPLNK